jgi:RHS repeat-associated protein
MSDADGHKVETSVARYLPYGGWRTEPTANLTDRAFTGQKENMDIGLYYYNARYYAPVIGRFISADIIVPDPTNPQNYNRYSYVLNQPTIGTDPDGHCYPICTAVAGGLIGGAVAGVTYYLTTSAGERNAADAALAIGTGVVGGVLIGTGIGIAGAGATAGATAVAAGAGASVTAASTLLVSAGTGTLVAAETNMIMNRVTGSSFDRTDFALSAIGATIEGAIAPGLGPTRSIIASGVIGASESTLYNAVQGDAINGYDAFISGLWGLGSAAAGSGIEGVFSMGSSIGQPISRGAQPVDLTWLNVRDPILRRWIANSAATDAASAVGRTFVRDLIYEAAPRALEEGFR